LRLPDVAEALDESLVQDVRGWDGRYWEDPVEVFKSIMQSKDWLGKRVGLETPAYYLSVENYLKVKAVLADTQVVEATYLIENLKLVKSPAELAYVRKAAEIADIGVDAITGKLALGLTELQVAGEAHAAMMGANGESPPSPMNFASGERSAYGHGRPTERVLKPGDFMQIEWGAQYRRYVSTIGRHWNMGQPSARAREIHDVTNEACNAYTAAVKAGVPGEIPHQGRPRRMERS
jgi:Xaa-Pro aminopeptidase